LKTSSRISEKTSGATWKKPAVHPSGPGDFFGFIDLSADASSVAWRGRSSSSRWSDVNFLESIRITARRRARFGGTWPGGVVMMPFQWSENRASTVGASVATPPATLTHEIGTIEPLGRRKK